MPNQMLQVKQAWHAENRELGLHSALLAYNFFEIYEEPMGCLDSLELVTQVTNMQGIQDCADQSLEVTAAKMLLVTQLITLSVAVD